MIKLVEGRSLEIGQKVEVYFNLHKKVFSIRDYKTKLVLAHGDNIKVLHPTFKVLESGRQKVLREQRKNVHAYVVGQYLGTTITPCNGDNIYYNPYKTDKFLNGSKDANLEGYTIAVLSNKTIKGVK